MSYILLYYILCEFAWKSCIVIGLEEGDILVFRPLERVTICLSLTLALASTDSLCN